MSSEGHWRGTWEEIRTGYPLTAVCETEYRLMRMAMAGRREEAPRKKGGTRAQSPLPARRNRDRSPVRIKDRRGRTPPRKDR